MSYIHFEFNDGPDARGFQREAGRVRLYKGPTPPSQTSSTVTQTNLPEYAEPYVTDIMERAQAQSYRPYTPYEGQRIAGFSNAQQAAQQETLGMGTPNQFGAAGYGLGGATQMGLNAGRVGLEGGLGGSATGTQMGYQYGQAGLAGGLGGSATGAQMGYGAGQAGLAGGLGGSATGAQMGYGVANQGMNAAFADPSSYMSPYMQNVVDVQKQQALRDAQKDQLVQNMGAARQGTYGGARNILAGTERERNLGFTQNKIQQEGLQNAYQAAMARQQGLGQLGQAGLQSGISAAGQLGHMGQAGLQSGISAAGQMGQMGQASLQTGVGAAGQMGQMGQAGMQGAISGGQALGELGTAEQAANLQRIQGQYNVGAQQQGLQQQQMDTQYADFLRQRDYPMEQLGYYQSLVRGMPLQMGSTATTYATPPSMGSQMAGAGLAALGTAGLSGAK
jgi:hypothetical protein